ncbi:hypothetical protein BG004_001436, partial [Podila humilis]
MLRTLRSTTRAAAAAASGDGPHNDNNSDGSSHLPKTTASAGGKFKELYKHNPIPKTAKEGITKRVKDDAKLRKQRRDELVSAKRFKRSEGSKEATDEDTELTKEQIDVVDAELKSGKSAEISSSLRMLSDYLTQFPGSEALQALVSSPSFLSIIE